MPALQQRTRQPRTPPRLMLAIVTSPPCSGKSTWVRQQARQGDIVVDLDRIALAIASDDTTHHDYPTHIRGAAIAMRAVAIDAAVHHHRAGGTAYVIHSAPSPRARHRYHRAGATFINLDAPTDVLMERARNERPPHVQRLIAAWQRTG